MKRYSLSGQQIFCQFCRHDYFSLHRFKLNTGESEFFNLAWADESAVCLVCEQCGYIHWFRAKGLIQELR